MFHAENPAERALRRRGRDTFSPVCAAQPCRRYRKIADRRGETDPTGLMPDGAGKPRDLTEHLCTAVGADQRVNLVDHDIAQIREQTRQVVCTVHQHGFERFRCDLQDPGGIFQKFGLLRRTDVSVPARQGNARCVEHLLHTQKLVVDQRFQRRDIEDGNGRHAWRTGRKFRKNRKKSRLRLSRRRRRGKQKVGIGLENHPCRLQLNLAQLRPAVRIDIFPDIGREAGKNPVRLGHGVLLSAIQNSRSKRLIFCFLSFFVSFSDSEFEKFCVGLASKSFITSSKCKSLLSRRMFRRER